MQAKISFITLAVDDLGRSVAFYRDGLGWRTEGIVGQEFHDEVTGADGTIAKIRNGDVIRLDAPAGRLEVLVADDVWAHRPHAEADLSGSHVGVGRELFGVFRGAVSSADEGVAIFPAA